MAASSSHTNGDFDVDSTVDSSMGDWMRTQPLSILQLDPADRIVLKIAGKPGEYIFHKKNVLFF